jgi:PAS domain-containing protein
MKNKSAVLASTELRHKAEALLEERKKPAGTIPEDVDLLRLVHELQVHQIELEMQNEALVQAQAELEWTLNMYAELYAFAPVGYLTLTSDGTVCRSNLTGAKMLGIELSDLIQRRLGLFIAPQSRTVFSAFLDKVFASQNKETCEVAIQKDGTAELWVSFVGICESLNGQGKLCYAIMNEIIEHAG